MSKFDKLVTQIEMFEKIAVYGDRSSFLKALAQDSLDPKAKSVIEQMRSLLQEANVTDPSILDPINNALMFNEVNFGAISNAVMKASNKMSSISGSDAASKLFQLAQQLVPNAQTPKQEVLEEKPAGVPFKALVNKGPGHGIDKEEQKALGKILFVERLGLPLEPDGVLGPKTREALDIFKDKFKLELKNKYRTEKFTDDQALTFAKMLSELPKYSKVPTFEQI